MLGLDILLYSIALMQKDRIVLNTCTSSFSPLKRYSSTTDQEDRWTHEDLCRVEGLHVPLPEFEFERIVTLRNMNILDTAPSDDYDRFTIIASRRLKVCNVFNEFLLYIMFYFIQDSYCDYFPDGHRSVVVQISCRII